MNSILYTKSVGSTNDLILDFIDPKSNGIFAVYTFDQTRGRGQYGNTWNMQQDKNIAYSFAIKAKQIKLRNSVFNFYTANALRNFITEITKTNTKLKWPNDIILGNKKISGILIEKIKVKNVEYYVAGMGINILQQDFDNINSAGSIKTQTGLNLDLHQFAKGLHELICKIMSDFPSEEKILTEYNEHLFRKDEISVFEINSIRQNGIIRAVDIDGFLNVELESGMKRFFHKEITLLY